jgi:O-antigen/teichoic acid export membrane protein
LSVTPSDDAAPLPTPLAADEQLTAEEVTQSHHRAARRGIKLLMIRQFGLQGFSFIGGAIIARKLGPAAFGFFGISLYLVNMLAQFADFGLAPSFIQRKAELTERDLRIGFTLQQILLSTVFCVIMVIAPWLARLYPHAPPDLVWFVRAMAFTLYLSSWRTMSALQLERNLRYERLARIEVLEALIYQSLAVTLAILGKGTWSYIIAMLAQGVVGTFLVYRACPWKIRFAFDARVARNILRYGIPFQMQILFNQMGDWVIPLFVGSRLGSSAVGLLTWSSANSKKPLMLVDNVMRVAYPHFSRLQDDRPEVERTLRRYLEGMLLMSAFWFAVLFVAGPALVRGIYQYKWEGAITTLAIYAATMAFDIITMVLATALNAIGNVNFMTRIALARSVLYMLFSVPFVFKIGYNGVPFAILCAQSLIIPWAFRGLGPGSLQRVMGPILWVLIPLAGSIAAGLAARSALVALHMIAPIQAIALIALLSVIFCACGWPVSPVWLRDGVRTRLRGVLKRFAS